MRKSDIRKRTSRRGRQKKSDTRFRCLADAPKRLQSTNATEIHIGICDHSKKNIGHRHIMNMIQDVVDRFAAEPLLNKKFRAEQDIEWAIQDEDTYPFYFGGVAISFNVPKIGRREPKHYAEEDRYC